MREAMYYCKLKDGKVQCALCPRKCTIAQNNRGFCKVRENQDGKLYSLVYGKPCAVEVDPVEKKPQYHFLPGSTALSIGTAGCNLACAFCQNWHMSQANPEDLPQFDLPPEKIVQMALDYKCNSVAYTYNEPTIFYEYVIDTAKIAKKRGVRNIFVTNGFINKEPLHELCKYIDAAHVDFKSFDDGFYRKITGAWLEPVKEAMKILKKEKVWFEIINLVIPTLNDDSTLIKKMCEWIRDNLGTEVPLHFSRFYPQYKLMHIPPTSVKALENARDIAIRVGLKYVYSGNVPGHPSESTYCPACRKVLIKRFGYEILQNNIKKGRCKFCSERIAGIFK